MSIVYHFSSISLNGQLKLGFKMFKTWLSSYVHHFVLLWHRGTVDSYYTIASWVVNECHSKKAVAWPSFRDFIMVPFPKVTIQIALIRWRQWCVCSSCRKELIKGLHEKEYFPNLTESFTTSLSFLLGSECSKKLYTFLS